ncbi:hypothetical protein H2200_010484 [Cladophialophora chaetospira]|uniref:Uncharacterized protein n=1 Tax=Cladophialophora chaetospira TaxID=386627 RepID=A0AA38X1K6_9EURO|nr:hypothetical protein H2200_010484 [Cladophialophora chaetospira]
MDEFLNHQDIGFLERLQREVLSPAFKAAVAQVLAEKQQAPTTSDTFAHAVAGYACTVRGWSIESLESWQSRLQDEGFGLMVSSILGEKLRASRTTALTVATLTSTAAASSPTSIDPTDPTASSRFPTSSPNNHTISWQTAFWALIAIAINTCLQHSGSVCDIDASLAIFVRSSPIFCVVDTIIVWCQTAYYTKQKGIHGALRLVAASRKQHEHQENRGSLSAARIMTGSIVLLVALLQSVKLFAFQGLPWTQTFAAMYLFTYLTTAALNFFGQPAESADTTLELGVRRGDIAPPPRLSHLMAIISAALQGSLWIFVITKAIPADWLESVNQCLLIPGYGLKIILLSMIIPLATFVSSLAYVTLGLLDAAILLGPGLSLVAAVTMVIKSLTPDFGVWLSDLFGLNVETFAKGSGTIVIAIIASTQYCFLGFVVSSRTFEHVSDLITPLFDIWEIQNGSFEATAALWLTAFSSYVLFRLVFIGKVARALGLSKLKIASTHGWAALFLFHANLGLTILYYAYVYQPETTYQPSWTKNLGRRLHRL